MVQILSESDDFKQILADNKIVVVDCFAEWCGPCKRIAPDFAKMSDQDAGAKYIKVDVDDLEDFAAEYSIEAMPTFLVFKDGELFKRVVGANIAGVQEAINAAKA
mmetsp:Transcript_585/g.1511  ORF Transcript_585/g.1511 Transcript_585/m.1511 type:complete len:105 (+) Transcript_585:398-712(+)